MEKVTDLDPEDIPMNVTYSQEKAIEMLQSLNTSLTKGTSRARILKALDTKLRQNHPIHKLLKLLSNSMLKDIANKISVTYNTRHDRMSSVIAKYFFN